MGAPRPKPDRLIAVVPIHAVNRVFSYTPEQVFDLVADVERYPEFLPWWIAARIEKSDGDVYHTDQVIGFRGLVRERFRTTTVLKRPERIDVTSDGGPFRRLHIQWSFEPAPDAPDAPDPGCLVGYRVDFELRSKLAQGLFAPLFGAAVRRVVGAFERRARQLYGPPRPPPPAAG